MDATQTLALSARPRQAEPRPAAVKNELWIEHGWALGLGPTALILLAALAGPPLLQALAHALWG